MKSKSLRMVIDASALVDARRHAGIGRYVEQLTEQLNKTAQSEIRLELHFAKPSKAPARDFSIARAWLASKAIITTALRTQSRFIHMTGNEPALFWPARWQIVTVHDVISWSTTARFRRPHPLTRLYFAVQKYRLQHCAAVITGSLIAAAEIIETLQVGHDKICVIPDGVSNIFSPKLDNSETALLNASGIKPNLDYLLWVGNLTFIDPRKGLSILVEAASKAKASNGKPITLICVGKTGIATEQLKKEAKRHDLKLQLTGFVDDQSLAAIYRHAKAVIIPSLHEGFGLPMLEAMACGAPVIATKAGSLVELAGDAAQLIEPGQVETLSKAITELLSSPKLVQRLKQAGPTRAGEFSWTNTAQITMGVYAKVLQR